MRAASSSSLGRSRASSMPRNAATSSIDWAKTKAPPRATIGTLFAPRARISSAAPGSASTLTDR